MGSESCPFRALRAVFAGGWRHPPAGTVAGTRDRIALRAARCAKIALNTEAGRHLPRSAHSCARRTATRALECAVLSPHERSLRGRIGAYALHAQYDPRETTRRGRAAFLARFEREVDPDGVLAPEERARRAEYARKAYFARLAYESARRRRQRRRPAAAGEARDGDA